MFWLDQAIDKLDFYRGQCIRKVEIGNQTELNYYQVGKVFMIQNIMQADCRVGPNDQGIENDWNMNVVFHIYSTEGRAIGNYLGFGTHLDKAAGGTILFPSGSQFLVCKRENVGNKINIYLRQVHLSLGHSVVLWADN